MHQSSESVDEGSSEIFWTFEILLSVSAEVTEADSYKKTTLLLN